MTGTALTEEDEFKSIYALDVVEVPTNRPMIRKDQNDSVYRTYKGKINAIVNQIKACREKGQPVLVGTVSIDKSEELSAVLKKAGIPHTVLNAKHHEKEAEIVAQAGRFGAVTISTNMAGRGTDIMLGGNPEYMAKNEMRKAGIDEGLIAMATSSAPSEDEAVNEARAMYRELYSKHKEEIAPEAKKVRDAGGLFILGTERHESRRIDNQLRGRSGRQGDPGESRFFLSLEDDLMRLFGSDRIGEMCERLGLDENTPIDAKILSGSIEGAQKRIEDNNFQRRKNVLTYDDVMNQQRNIIYQQRGEVLMNDNIQEKITSMIRQSVEETFDFCFGVDTPSDWKFDEFRNHYLGLLTDENNFNYTEEQLASINKDEWKESLVDRAIEIYHSKDALFASVNGLKQDAMREVEKVILLQNVDKKWMDHLEAMDELKEYVGLNSYAQRDPVAMYRIQGADLFDQMVDDIKEDTVRQILSVIPRPQAMERVQVAKPTSENLGGDTPIVRKPVVKNVRVGRNDPCPCGSGKKYKKCCGQNESSGKE
jgi:preprotein translocase subunit SecA